jgi:hypothetical protein
MKKTRMCSGGFTLLQLVISLTLLAVVMAAAMSVLISASSAVSRQQDISLLHRESEIMQTELSKTISRGFGWIYGDSTCLVLVTEDGDSVKYHWSENDSMLFQDTQRLFSGKVKVQRFCFYFMPKSTAERTIPIENWLQEVDLDRSGSIEGGELLLVDYITIKYQVIKNRAEYHNAKDIKLPPAITGIIINN